MNRVLVTGADGYLGSRIVASCLADHRDVIAWIHARNPVELEHRSHALKERLGGDLECAGGDLLDPDAFSTIDPLGISAIVHAAAVTRFDVDRRAARRVNVAGTSAAAALAQRCPRLERFVFLGSAFAAGLLEGSIEEGPLAPDGFANNYEWSKWKSEQVLQEDHAELPWTVLRAATVIADDESGACGQLNVVHDTLRLLYQGLLSVIPGEPSVPVCLVTADMVAQAAVRLLEGPFVGRSADGTRSSYWFRDCAGTAAACRSRWRGAWRHLPRNCFCASSSLPDGCRCSPAARFLTWRRCCRDSASGCWRQVPAATAPAFAPSHESPAGEVQ